ncbi:Spo0E family sporulation regulatory protein-aspartic acid phosphatase [Bacillus salipaludis]|uniref:Spo0E family sporulation regulatory protein-aspartic acid phosphatase n=1 Tax=Bacillus salipaludis TaxID=2547811 RepID=A0ABW8RLR7_9BACI
MYKYSNRQFEMIEEIKVKRELMINSANRLGFTSDETIKHSQELDELINMYQRTIGQTSRANEEVKFAFKQMVMIWPKVLV